MVARGKFCWTLAVVLPMIAIIIVFAANIVPTVHAKPQGAIKGYVTDAITGDPIKGATVTAYIDGSPEGSDTTNVLGYYSLVLLADRTYEVTASKEGFASNTKPVDDLPRHPEVTALDFELAPYVQHVIPEVPWGTLIASASMISALLAYALFPKFIRKS